MVPLYPPEVAVTPFLPALPDRLARRQPAQKPPNGLQSGLSALPKALVGAWRDPVQGESSESEGISALLAPLDVPTKRVLAAW